MILETLVKLGLLTQPAVAGGGYPLAVATYSESGIKQTQPHLDLSKKNQKKAIFLFF